MFILSNILILLAHAIYLCFTFRIYYHLHLSFIRWCHEDEKTGNLLTNTLISLSVDATCDHVSDSVTAALDRLLPPQEGPDSSTSPDPFHLTLHSHLLTHVESLLQSPAVCDG